MFLKSKGLINMGELRKIPGVGKEIEKDLIELGINSIDDLKGRRPTGTL